jgi:hypothetical protein
LFLSQSLGLIEVYNKSSKGINTINFLELLLCKHIKTKGIIVVAATGNTGTIYGSGDTVEVAAIDGICYLK